MRVPLAALMVSVLSVLVAAGPSQAATAEVRFSGTVAVPPEPKGGSPGGNVPVYTLYYKAGGGEANDLTAASVPGGVKLSDAGAPIGAGPGCRAEGADVICTGVSAGEQYELGDGDDKATIGTGAIRLVDAAEGNDAVRVVDGSGEVRLGPGDDSVVGEYASPGTILALRVDGGSGADAISATAPRMITVSYADRTGPVSASLDGMAGDGEAGEGDQLGGGIGAVTGGAGPDTISGGAATENLNGGPGDDLISGGGDKDFLVGGEGNDTLHGDEGDEAFTADPGADTVRGGAGFDSMSYMRTDDKRSVNVTIDDQPGDGLAGENDDVGTDVEAITGGLGDDRLTGSEGPDVLSALGGSDFVDGRGGADTLFGNTPELTTGGGSSDLVGGSGVDSFKQVGLLDDVIAVDGEADAVECAERGIAPIMGDLTDTGTGCLSGFDVPSRRGRLKVDRRGFLRLPTACEDIGVVCRGSVALVAPDARTRRITGRVLARGRLRVENRRPHSVRLRLSRRARAGLARRRSLKVRASFATTRELPAESRVRSESVRLVAARR